MQNRTKQMNSSIPEKFAQGHMLGNLLTELESLESSQILQSFSHLFSMQWVKFIADEIPLALLSVLKPVVVTTLKHFLILKHRNGS